MKHLKQHLFFVAVLCCATSVFAQQNWMKLETDLPTDVNSLHVDAVDGNVVWASLDSDGGGAVYNPVNKIIRTADAGATWSVAHKAYCAYMINIRKFHRPTVS